MLGKGGFEEYGITSGDGTGITHIAVKFSKDGPNTPVKIMGSRDYWWKSEGSQTYITIGNRLSCDDDTAFGTYWGGFSLRTSPGDAAYNDLGSRYHSNIFTL